MSIPTQNRPVRFAKLQTQGRVAGLELSNLLVLFVAVGIATGAVLRYGLVGLVLTLPFTAVLTLIGVGRSKGVPLPIIIYRELTFMFRKAAGVTKQRYVPERAKLHGKLNLPGRSSSLHLYEDSFGHLVVYDARNNTAAITCHVSATGFYESSPEAQDEKVRLWSQVLGQWTLREGIHRVSIVERAAPGSVSSARAYYAANAAVVDTPFNRAYEESLDISDTLVVRHLTQLTITLDLSVLASDVKAHGGGRAGVVSIAYQEMNATRDALLKAGFGDVRWLTPRQWAATGRSVIDPDYASVVEARGMQLGIDPVAIGPMAMDEERSYVVTDSGYHRSFWIHEWPRLETYPGFVNNVVFARLPDGGPVRHVLNIVTSPVAIRAAMKRIEDAKRTWVTNSNLRQKTSKPESAADRADWVALEQQEAALVAGQGEYEFAGYITVSATSLEELERASQAMRNGCAMSGLEPQILYAQQAEALMVNAFPTGQGIR